MPPTRIRVLSDQTINQIAAGEVIENPASVVKELVENSIDAGATYISIEIEEGGRHVIRISDNGCGMLRDDALLCLERHATSKIAAVEDVQSLDTMGFRGEAIPSIASISKFTLVTAPNLVSSEQDVSGTLLRVEGGKVLSCNTAHRSPGTTIEVNSLFFNVPVRRKFQKSPRFDTQEITHIVNLIALANPTISFELISDQKVVLKTLVNHSKLSFAEHLKQRVCSIFGEEHVNSLLSLKFQKDAYELDGFIGPPHLHKPNKKGQYLFINKRPVASPMISMIVREGYATMLTSQRYPIFVLHLRMPGSLVDVNVHPQKKEVRLRHEQQLKEVIIHSIQNALSRKETVVSNIIPAMTACNIDKVNINTNNVPMHWGSFKQKENIPYTLSEEVWEFQDIHDVKLEQKLPWNVNEHVNILPIEIKTPTHLQKDFYQDSPVSPRVIDTMPGYCLLDASTLFVLVNKRHEMSEGGFGLLDQHAAYARIHYERLLQRAHMTTETQQLLIPLTLQLNVIDMAIVRLHFDILHRMGFEVREFGENTLIVDAFPIFLKQQQLATCLNAMIQEIVKYSDNNTLEEEKQHHLALIACRTSIPSARRLSIEEANMLIKQLILCNVPKQCPLGKSTCLYFSPQEIAKWFHKSF